MNFTNNYPDAVQDFSNKVINTLIDDGIFKQTFKEEPTSEQYQMCFDEICKHRFDNFIKGEPLELRDLDEVRELIDWLILKITYDRLKKKGLIDMIEDENGEEHYFLTEAGKRVKKELDTNKQI